jgi:hypothetical protein
MDEATAIAAEILRVVSQPVFVSGTSLPVSASIGIALHPQDARAGDELLMRAGMALDGAKRDGRRKHKFFTQDMSRHGEERVILGAALRGCGGARRRDAAGRRAPRRRNGQQLVELGHGGTSETAVIGTRSQNAMPGPDRAFMPPLSSIGRDTRAAPPRPTSSRLGTHRGPGDCADV